MTLDKPMTTKTNISSEETIPNLNHSSSELYSQVHLKSDGKRLLLILPKATQQDPLKDWIKIFQDINSAIVGPRFICARNTSHADRRAGKPRPYI